MAIRHFIAAGAGAALVGMVACGGGASSSCGDYFDAVVSHATQCSGSVQVDSTTKSNFQKYCDSLATQPGVSNLGGQVDQCASLTKSSSCTVTPSCIIAGTLANGAACGNSTQCAGGRCVIPNTTPTTNEVVCGTCASYLAVGADCTSATSACDPTTSACTGGKCVAFAAQGASCASAPCASGLDCDTASKTCMPPPTKGQACTGTCGAPYRCVSGTCADAVETGGACPTGAECDTSLVCDPQSHTCAAPHQAAAGEACGFVNQTIVDCQTDLRCSPSGATTYACIVPKAAGESCTVGKSECQDFLVCTNGTCQLPDYTVCK